jgi:DNA repair protein SbcC/Rad50
VKLTVKAFQSHANTALDLRDTFICVVGANNVGKSALIRAVEWNLYDAFRGSKFIKKGQKEASVEMQLGETIVKRLKGRGINAYVLNGKQFDAIKSGVPPEVTEALGTQPIQIDKDLVLKINIVKQTEHPFLMNETGTTRAKVLNALTGHHVLDVAIRNTVAETRRLQGEQKHLTERQVSLEEDAKGFKDLPEQEKKVFEARKKQNELEALVESTKRGRELLDQHQAAVESHKNAHKLSEKELPQVDRLWSRAEATLRRQDALQEAIERREMAVRARKAIQTMPEEPLPLLEDLWKRAEKLKAKKEAMLVLQNYKVMAGNARQTLTLLEKQYERGVEQFRMLKGSMCPTCNQPISEKAIIEAAA